MRRRWLLAGVLALAACSAGRKPEAPTKGPTQTQPIRENEAQPPSPPGAGPDRQYQQPSYGAQPGPPVTSGGATTALGPTMSDALDELDRAASALSTATSCPEACRALASMQRAAARICELVDEGDPEGRCARAEARLRTWRERVEAKCGTCPE